MEQMIFDTNNNMQIVGKIEKTLMRIREFEPKDGYYLAFSGGKDSITCYHLLKLAGVKFDAHYNLTTVDPPELVRFIKTEYPDVEITYPEISMWRLIEKKGMPMTRLARYCCAELKEGGGKGRFVVTGVRWVESVRRKNTRSEIEFDSYGSQSKQAKERREIFLNSDNDERRNMIENCAVKGKHILNPIVDWEDWEVWSFIKQNGFKYPSLYDEGFDRLGCIGCPMQGRKGMLRDFEIWPKYKQNYIKAFDRMVQKRKEKGLEVGEWKDGQTVFDWWVQNNG